MSKRNKILVTGSGGFIFSNFIRKVLYDKPESNYTIVSIDKVKKSQAIYNVYTNKNHLFYIGDVVDQHFVNTIFEIERPDIVVHGAAETHVDTSIENAIPFISSNIMGTQVIIDACLRWNVNKLVYISSDGVYGHLTSEEDASWAESSPLAPRNPYAASKASGELLVHAANKTHGLTYNIIRSCNNYGPRQATEKFLPKIIKHILEEKNMPIYGEGKQVRDWLHVFDNCDAILKVIENGAPNETYNISANQEYSNLEVFQMVCNTLGRGYNLIEFLKDRSGHDFRYSLDSSKLRKLGWSPQYKFTEGLVQTCQWFINNQWYLRQ